MLFSMVNLCIVLTFIATLVHDFTTTKYLQYGNIFLVYFSLHFKVNLVFANLRPLFVNFRQRIKKFCFLFYRSDNFSVRAAI